MSAALASAPQPRADRHGGFTLAELAQAVRLAAWTEAAGLGALEVMAARAHGEPAFARGLDDASRQGRALAAVHALLLGLMADEAGR